MNYLSQQYLADNSMKNSHNYLAEQFSNADEIFEQIRILVNNGDFTLGAAVDKFEAEVANFTKAKYVIGLGSGTDAIELALRAVGVSHGDEVITTPFTFYATIGAIIATGATPVFCDIGDDFNIDTDKIPELINKKTKAIVPVHWSGEIANLRELRAISKKFNIPIVEDACHAFGALYENVHCGAGAESIAAFSLHPLKNLNCWGDGGFIVTNREDIANKLRLTRNHGLTGRDSCQIWGFNSRLDSIQAIVASWLLKKLPDINEARRANAAYLDLHLKSIPEIKLPTRKKEVLHSYHIYSFLVNDRENLIVYLRNLGIDAKVHYPTCMHLQPAAKNLSYRMGDFPNAEFVASRTLSLPIHEFIKNDQLDFMVHSIRKFYGHE